MKSHDTHVFIETLLQIAFSATPADVLEPLLDFSDFFNNICANEQREDHLMKTHRNIPLILCKLETVFPPEFWNIMEHRPIYLAQEAYLSGPVHFFNWLKKQGED